MCYFKKLSREERRKILISEDLEKERKRLDREITFFHFKRAKKIIDKCLRIACKRKEEFFINYFTAQDCILKEKYSEAIKYLEKALHLRRNDGCSYNDKAICLAELGRYKEALQCFNEGIMRDKDCVSLYHNKGWLLNLLEKHKQAVLCFQKALELEPKRVESLYSLGDSYLNLGEEVRAKKYFSLALKEIKGKSHYIYKQIVNQLGSERKKL